jgi:HK97 family phage portal protein
MGLGRLLTRSTEYTATDTVTGATATFTVLDNLGPQFANMGTYQAGMTIPGAWRASTMLADLLGQVPWNAYRQMVGRPEELLDPRPPLLEQPFPPETRMNTFSSAGLDEIWHGNALFVIAARNFAGWPTAVVPVPANSCGVRRVTSYVDSPLPIGAIEYSIGRMRLGSGDVIHIKGPCEPGALRGMGVLEAHLQTLNLALDQSRQARNLTNPGVPTGVLKSSNPDLKDDEAADMKAAWMASQRDRSVAVINSATEFEPLSWNPEQGQVIESRKFTLGELELIFGLPVGWLGGAQSSKTYSNIEADAVNLLKFSLGGHLARFEQTFSLAFPRGTVARANLDAVLRADTLTRYQAHKIALGDAPFLTVDEVREYEHRGPMPEQEKPAAPEPFTAEPQTDPMMAPPPLPPARGTRR